MPSVGDLAKTFVFATELQCVNIISTLFINIWYIFPLLNSYNCYFLKKKVMVDAQLAPPTGALDPTYWRSRKAVRDDDTKEIVFLEILNQCMC
jgi:hypothetical protein